MGRRAMISTLYHGLAEEIKVELSIRDKCLEALITLAIRIDNRRLERQRERDDKNLASSSLYPPILSPAVLPTHPETGTFPSTVQFSIESAKLSNPRLAPLRPQKAVSLSQAQPGHRSYNGAIPHI